MPLPPGVDHEADQRVGAADRRRLVRQEARPRPEAEDGRLGRARRRLARQVPLRDVDEVGRAHLRLPLHAPRGREVAGVDHHQHRVHPHAVGEVRPPERPHQGQGVGEARGLEEEPVEVATARELADRVHEVGVPDAAGAALGDLDPGPGRDRRVVDAGEAALVLEDAHPQRRRASRAAG